MLNVKQIEIQGHRGARGLYPENTITAFIEAVKLGVHTLEMDGVISKDHKVIVSHEAWMNADFCSLPDGGQVKENAEKEYNLFPMTYAEILRFDCGKRQNVKFPMQKTLPEYKPLLSEVIAKTESFTKDHDLPQIKYNIEIKSDPKEDGIYNPAPGTFVDLVLEVVRKYDILPRIILQSFDVRILQEIKKKDPGITISLLVENTDGLEINLERLGFAPAIYAPEFVLVDEQLVKHLHSKNIQLIPWTVNETEDMKKLITLGVEGIITDYPDRLINLMKKEKKQ